MPAKTHGEAHKTHEWHSWTKMKERCRDKNHRYYHNYGGAGITICERWITSFENFLADMGRAPSLEHTLDRIDNSGSYEPVNCRWATKKEQANNRKSNRILEYCGQKYTMAYLAEMVGIDQHMLAKRLARGWTVERAVETPHAHALLYSRRGN